MSSGIISMNSIGYKALFVFSEFPFTLGAENRIGRLINKRKEIIHEKNCWGNYRTEETLHKSNGRKAGGKDGEPGRIYSAAERDLHLSAGSGNTCTYGI